MCELWRVWSLEGDPDCKKVKSGADRTYIPKQKPNSKSVVRPTHNVINLIGMTSDIQRAVQYPQPRELAHTVLAEPEATEIRESLRRGSSQADSSHGGGTERSESVGPTECPVRTPGEDHAEHTTTRQLCI